MAEAAEDDPLAALQQRLDDGLGLDEPGYVQVLASVGDAAALQQLNAGAPAAAPRVAVLSGVAAATVPSLIEQYLIAPGRTGAIVILPELQQEHKKRRISSLPDGVSYDGNSFAGRVNFLPSSAALALIGKRTTSWKRLQGGQQTHKVAAHEVRRVVPFPAPAAAVQVAAIQMAADGTADLQTAAAHPFSGAKQLATLAGLPGGLDGHYPIVASDRRKSQLLFRIKLPRQEADTVAAVQQAVAGGGITVSEQFILDDTHTLCHFMLVEEGAAAGQAAAAAAEGGEATVAAAGGPAAAATAAAGAAAGQMVPALGFPAANPAAALGPLDFGAAPAGAGAAAAGLGGMELPMLPELPLHAADMPGGDLCIMQLDAVAGNVLLDAPPFFFEAAAPLPQQAQQQAQQGQQQQQQLGAGGVQPPGAPGAAAQAAPAAGHAVGEGHFRLLTVGGEQPVAGGPLYPDAVMVVQGGAQVEGPMKAQSFAVVSDERAKERIQEFALAEGKRALDLALGITCAVFNYKGEAEQRLGVIAQQVERELLRHGGSHLGIVQRSAQGELSIDIPGLVTLLLASVQGLAGDMKELREQLAVMSLAAAGALQDTAAAARVATAGGRGTAGGSAAAAVHGLGSCASGGSLQAAASSSSNLSQLLDPGDVEMEASSSSTGEEGPEAEQPSGPTAAAAQQAAAAAAEDEGEFAGLSDEAVAALLQQRLELGNPHMRKKFEKLASKLSRAALWQVYQETLSQPTELTAQGDRPRTLGGHFVKAAGRRAAEEEVRRKAGAAPPPPKSLRTYQQRLLEAAKQGGNWIIVAPTGSGKTDVAVAYAVHVLQRDHSARVVFLAPTVALAEQQAGFFLAAPAFSSGTFRVTCRAGDSTLQPRDWSRVLEEHHVVVMTPQTFLNALDSGYVHVDDLALLVVDECHHAQADHPTACILRAWHKSSQRTQILGLTASPAAKASLTATYEALARLAANLGAQYLVLDETDPEVQAVVPQVAQEEIVVELAQQDTACAACLGGFVVAAVQQLRPLLPSSVPDLPAEVLAMLAAGRWTATAVRWTVAAADALQAASQPGGMAGTAQQEPQGASPATSAPADRDLQHALLLVRAAVAALALVSDVGFEAALRHLSKEYFEVAAKVACSAPAHGSAAAPAGGPHATTASLLAQLADAVDHTGVLPGAFSTEGGVLGRHPKFQALVTFLQRYSDQPAFHGIVFTRTREGARSVAQLLAAAPALEGVQIYCFMGHGGRSSTSSTGGGSSGMTSKQQQAVMADFRQPGRRLLVSTSAGEEGIDVPRCEFVVRYTATQTGRERVQSAGRARKFGSRFVEIIEDSHEELALIRKSRTEEANMRAAVRALGVLGLAS